jgi:hypothetical protein
MPPKSCPLQKTVDMGVICFLAKTYMIFFVVLDVKTSTTPKLLIHIRSWKRQSLIHTEKIILTIANLRCLATRRRLARERKRRFSSSSEYGSRKKSRWMVGELYMSYGGISCEKQDWLRRGYMW